MKKDFQSLKETMEALQNQLNSLQQRVSHLENQTNHLKNALRHQNKAAYATKTTQQGDCDYTLKDNKDPYSLSNDGKLNSKVGEGRNKIYSFPNQDRKLTEKLDSNILSEDHRGLDKAPSTSQQYNLSSTLLNALKMDEKTRIEDHPNLVTLSQISEEEKIKIIKTSFHLNQEGKISLKEYYESTAEYSLFQLYGYSIKYESICRTKLYQQLK